METKLVCLDANNKVVNIVLASDDIEADKQNLINAYGYANIVFIEADVACEIGNIYQDNIFVDSPEQILAKEEGLRLFQEKEKEIAKRKELLERLNITEEEAKLLLGGN